MPPIATKNLGLVAAVLVGTSAPTNTIPLWYDDNTGVKALKYYDTFLGDWFTLTSATTPDIGDGDQNYIPVISLTDTGKIREFTNSPLRIGGLYTTDLYGSIAADVGSPASFYFQAKGGSNSTAFLAIYNNDGANGQDVTLGAFNGAGTIGSQLRATHNQARIEYWSGGVISSEIASGVSGNSFSSSITNLFIGSEIAFSGVSGITNNRVTYVNGTGKLVTSSVTDTVLGYIANLTSDAQTQINALQTGSFWKAAVRAATTGNINLSAPGSTIDGVTMVSGDRFLSWQQSTASENGIYIWNGAATPATRATDFDTQADNLSGATVNVQEGTTLAETRYTCTTNNPITIGVTSITFVDAGGSTYLAGAGLTLGGNTFSIGTGAITNTMLAGSITAAKLVGTDIATVGTLTAGSTGTGFTLALGSSTITGILSGANGGTGIANTGVTMTFASNFVTTGTLTPTLAFPTGGSATYTYPSATSTLLANNLGISGGSTIIGGTAVADKLAFRATSFASNTASNILYQYFANSASTIPLLAFGDGGGTGDNYFYSAQSSPSVSTNYFLRAGASYSYFNAATDLRFNVGGTTGIVLSSSSISLRQATTMFTAMSFTYAAGTTTVAPAIFQTGGSLLTTIAVGRKEYNNAFYSTNNALNRYSEGGVIASFLSDVNNSGTGETDLFTYTTKANTLGANGESLEVLYSGTVNDATATTQFKVYFGGTVILDTTALTLSATGNWVAEVNIIRISSTVIRYTVTLHIPSAATSTTLVSGELTGLTLSNTNIIKITGTAGGAGGGSNDITAKMGTIKWWGAAANV